MGKRSDADIILEDMNAKFDVMLEAISSLRDDLGGMARQSDLEVVKSDAKVIKAAVTDLSKQVNDPEQRIAAVRAA
jgi:hypothetical protein